MVYFAIVAVKQHQDELYESMGSWNDPNIVISEVYYMEHGRKHSSVLLVSCTQTIFTGHYKERKTC